MKQISKEREQWRSRPENTWSFRNIDAIIPTESIANDSEHIEHLHLAESCWNPGLFYRSLFKLTSTDALVVLVDGELRYEYYAQGNGPQTPHILMSSSKSVTGLLLGILAHEDKIDYALPVSHYLPEMEGTRYAKVSIRDLIDMRVKIVLNPAEQRAYDLATNWEPASATPSSANLKTFFQSLSGSPVEAGGPFRYVSANTDLLGWIIERATGSTFAHLLEERLWKPMGAECPAYVTLDQDGLARCAGGICTTARDFAKLGQLLLSQGKSGDRPVIPSAVIDDIRRHADRSAWSEGQWGRLFAPISKNMGYRSGWYVVDDAPNRMFAMGIYGQGLFIDFESRVVVAKFSSWKRANDPIPFFATHKVFSRLRAFRN
jgi:CubicO group peptidase (beta-lactamase class C family)